MNSATIDKLGSNIRISDPRLQLLISNAVIELDAAARGETVKLESTRRFLDILRRLLSGENPPSGTRTQWLDPATTGVMGDALILSGRAPHLKTVTDVIEEAFRFVEEAKSEAEEDRLSDTEELSRFCIAFGNSLQAHRHQYRPEPPANPYRR